MQDQARCKGCGDRLQLEGKLLKCENCGSYHSFFARKSNVEPRRDRGDKRFGSGVEVIYLRSRIPRPA